MVSRLRRTFYRTLLSQRPLIIPLRKAQFERHFRQWGFQKYKKRDIWVAVASRRAKRKREQKETEVWMGHERIPKKKLKKELARYDYDVAFPYGFQGKYLLKNAIMADI
jgi:hypothetical protein